MDNDSIADGMSDLIRRELTKGEMSSVLELIDRSVRVDKVEELKSLNSRIKGLFEHEYLSCGLGILDAEQGLRIGFALNCSYPEEFFSRYIDSGLIKHDPIVLTEFEAPRLYYIDDILGRSRKWILTEGYELARSYGIKEGYSIGYRNEGRGLTSMFLFMGPSIPRSERSELILDLVGPHLHAALCRVAAAGGPPAAAGSLSARETEVLQWIKAGRSTWQISLQLSLSEATIKFHVKNLMRKLDASTRTQALAEAIQRGYISLD